MRRRDEQYVCSVRGERTAAHRTRDDSREIQDAHAAQRARRDRKRLRRRVADTLDREHWQRGHRYPLRVVVPFLEGPLRRDHESRLGCSLFKLLRAPVKQRLLYGCLVVVAGEQRQHTVAVMREIGVQTNPAAIAAAVYPSDLVPNVGRRLPVNTEIALATELDGRMAHVDRDELMPSAAQVPQLGR